MPESRGHTKPCRVPQLGWMWFVWQGDPDWNSVIARSGACHWWFLLSAARNLFPADAQSDICTIPGGWRICARIDASSFVRRGCGVPTSSAGFMDRTGIHFVYIGLHVIAFHARHSHRREIGNDITRSLILALSAGVLCHMA